MDKRKHYVMVLDTETANTHDDNEKLDMRDAQVYDCGFVITDRKGTIYEKHSYIVKETFLDSEMMSGAYYADKIPAYWYNIWEKKCKVVSLSQLRSIICEKCEEYQVEAIVAHNARFDYNALNATIRYNTDSKQRYFLPYGIEIWDTMKMAHDTIYQMKSYKAFCQENGFMTAHKTPHPRITAEVLYRFITQETNFEEHHTGLEDVLIETAIMAECFKKHKKMRKKLWEDA